MLTPGQTALLTPLLPDVIHTITPLGTALEFETNVSIGATAAAIDSTHWLTVYEGPSADGFAFVLAIDGSGNLTMPTAAFEFDTVGPSSELQPFPVMMDADQAVIVKRGTATSATSGVAEVLNVNLGTWAVTSGGSAFEFDIAACTSVRAVKANATTIVAVYRGSGNDGFAIALSVNLGTGAITAPSASLEFDTSNGLAPSIQQINGNPERYLVTYEGGGSGTGVARVLTLDTSTLALTATSSLTFETGFGQQNEVVALDGNHFLNIWRNLSAGNSRAQVLEVNLTTWAITAIGTPIVIEGNEPDASGHRSNSAVVLYENAGTYYVARAFREKIAEGSATKLQVLSVNSSWAVTAEAPVLASPDVETDHPFIQAVSDSRVIVWWTDSPSTDGFVQAFDIISSTVTSTVIQEGFRWRNDNGSETTATWKAAQDIDALLEVDDTARLRVLLDSTGNPDPAAYTLYYKNTLDSTWLPVLVGAGGGDPVYIAASTNITASGQDTTPQLTPPTGKTTGAFVTGRVWDDENGIDEIDLGPPTGPVELTLSGGATTFTPWVQLQVGSTSTVSWKDSTDTTITTGLKPTITTIPTDRIIRMYVTGGGLPTMNEVDSLNLGFDYTQDPGVYNLGTTYDHPGQPVVDIDGIQLLSEMRYFMAAMTPLNTSLILSGMNNLEFVECFGADITTVDLTGCTSLVRLCLEGAAVESLNLSPVKNVLADIRCAGNPGPVVFTSDGPLTELYHYCTQGQPVLTHIPPSQLPAVTQYWVYGTGIIDIVDGFTALGPAPDLQIYNNPLSAASIDTLINSCAATGVTNGALNAPDSDYPTSASASARATLLTRSWGVNVPATAGGSNADGTYSAPSHGAFVNGDLTNFSASSSVTGGVLTYTSSGYGRTIFQPGGRSAGPCYFEVALDRSYVDGSGPDMYWGLLTNCNSSGNGGLRAFINWNELSSTSSRGVVFGPSNTYADTYANPVRIAANPSGWTNSGTHTVGMYHAGRRAYVVLDGVKVFYAQREEMTTSYSSGGYVGIAGDSQGGSRLYQTWGLSVVTLP